MKEGRKKRLTRRQTDSPAERLTPRWLIGDGDTNTNTHFFFFKLEDTVGPNTPTAKKIIHTFPTAESTGPENSFLLEFYKVNRHTNTHTHARVSFFQAANLLQRLLSVSAALWPVSSRPPFFCKTSLCLFIFFLLSVDRGRRVESLTALNEYKRMQ